jgi:C-terminal novel E3 ligase, LRR-interacting/Leucine rich repeat
MISSIRNCISIPFNHLVIHAKKLNSLTSRIKEYVTHKFKNIADCFKDISFLRNRRFTSSNQTSTIQNNNSNVNQIAVLTLHSASDLPQQPQSATALTTDQEQELDFNPAEESGVNQLLTSNLGSNSNESINPFVNNQPLTLDRLNEALEVWTNDPNATGNKLEASEIIRKAFQNKSIDLNLDGFQLNNLPAIIGNLTQLQKIYLRDNQLQVFPAEISKLTQLQYISVANNKLQVLPAEIGNLTQLEYLIVTNNQLQVLPAEIGNLNQLKRLHLVNNQNLAELPLSLGELLELSYIDIDDTQISREACESILAQCQAKRRGQDAFIPRLQKWFVIAGMKDVDLNQFNTWDISHQNTAKEWLFRLEKTQDYQGNQKNLAQVVCAMLKSVAEDKTFKDLFMNQAEANNTACQDRSAMGLNELYTAWKIYLMEKDQTSSLQDKLCVLIQAGKTIALRGYLTDLINKQEKQNHRAENESVEIFLYYETVLKNELNLLSVIERMSYSEIGKRDWIDVNQLKKEVNDQYVTHLVDIPAFIATAKEDQYFKEQIDSIDAESRKKLEDLGEYPTNDEFSEEVLEWKTKMGEINEQHKQSRILMVKKWLETAGIS